MLDIKYIRQFPGLVQEKIAQKGSTVDINELLALDEKRRALLQEAETLRASRKKNESSTDDARDTKLKLKNIEEELKTVESEFNRLMRELPNLPVEGWLVGTSETDNRVVREVGEKREFSFAPKDYLTLATSLGLIDMERGAKVSGSRMGYIKGSLARLEFALVSYAFDMLSGEGFTHVVPPVMVKPEMMEAMGFIDKGDEDVYKLERDNMYLVGTSEQSVVPMHADEVFKAEDLPRRYVSFSTCFRREAGSYGKDTKGILRVHQFDKVEMLSFTTPEHSLHEHEFLVGLAERLMISLKIPYRLVQLSTGDISRPSAGTYDIETWMPGTGTYRETHSLSTTTDYQARRLNIKYDAGAKKEYVHILNGTAFAIQRMLIAIIENYQQEDGSIAVPEVLQKYLEFDRII